MGCSKTCFGPSLLLAAAVLLSAANAYDFCATGETCQVNAQDKQDIKEVKEQPFPIVIKEDFQFEIRNIYTNRQRGARLNIFVKFRYCTPGIMSGCDAETYMFDYQEMKNVIKEFVPAGGKGVPGDTFWEVLNRKVAEAVWGKFHLRGLTIRLEVQGMSSGGIASHRASTVTVGDVEPWVSSANSFPGCDGMSTGRGNKACLIVPTWNENGPEDPAWPVEAANKANHHDKPKTFDSCS